MTWASAGLRLLGRPLCWGCLLAFALGCGGTGVPKASWHSGSVGLVRAASSRQVMVTLAADTPRSSNRAAWELERRYRLRIVYAWDLQSLGARCLVFQIPGDMPLPLVLKQLAADPRVTVAQPVQWFEVLAGGDEAEDPYQHLQHGIETLGLGEAHRVARGRGVTVAVIDTGIDIEHPDLEGRVQVARNFVRHGRRSFAKDVHGTAVAGIIAAGRNGRGIVGVAPEARVMALKACWQAGQSATRAVCNSYTLALALDYAISHGARIVNLSLAGPRDPILAQLIQAGHQRGALIIAATDGSQDAFPASLATVVAVASGPAEAGPVTGLEALRAPGTDILTTVPGGSWDFLSGSSFAAAHVSGVSALLLEQSPSLGPGELASILRRSAIPEESSIPGFVNARIALRAALAYAEEAPAENPEARVASSTGP